MNYQNIKLRDLRIIEKVTIEQIEANRAEYYRVRDLYIALDEKADRTTREEYDLNYRAKQVIECTEEAARLSEVLSSAREAIGFFNRLEKRLAK